MNSLRHISKNTFFYKISLYISIIFLLPNFGLAKSKIYNKIGVCTSFKNAEILSKIGYSSIEEGVGGFLVPLKTEEEFNELLTQAQKIGFPILSCNSFIPANLKSVGSESVPNEILKFAETAFRRAQIAGVEIIVFGSGGSRSIPEGFSKEEARKQFIKLCSDLGPIAKKYNITVVLEPLNTKECNFINSVTEGGEIVKEINHPNIRLLADIYHMMMDNENPASIVKYGKLIKHIHVAEKEDRAAPGTHNEDLTSYYKALKQIKYKGRIMVECRWENLETQAGKAFETIHQQLNQLKSK
jgi:sugar phosphate isomerase/epimerase